MTDVAVPNPPSGVDETPAHMPQLDALRAFAVASVAYMHWMPKQYQYGLPFGSAGVQLFFVLSGFLITSILVQCRQATDRSFALRNFYARRFLRIFPLYYSVVAVAWILDLGQMRSTVLWHLCYLSNIHFFLDQSWGRSLSHFWSLSVEEQFYLFWPVVVLFCRGKDLVFWCLALCGVGLLSNLCLPWLFPGTKLLNVLPNSNFFALGLGGLLAMRPASPTLLRRLLAWSAVALPIFVIVAAAMVAGVRFRGIGQLRSLSMIVGFFWLIGRASVGFNGWAGRVLTLPILVFLGRISYGIYILHNFSDWPVNLFCQRVFGTTDLTLFQRIPLKTIATLMGASVSWFCLERPLSRLKSRIPYRRNTTVGTQSPETEPPTIPPTASFAQLQGRPT